MSQSFPLGHEDTSGSLLDWGKMDWKKMTHTKGYMDIVHVWAYVDNNQGQGIRPSLPFFVMRKAMQIEKGKVYHIG